MTIIRSKVSQDFTILNNSVLNDKDFDSKYLGTYVRLISKSQDWEISISGLTTLYPTNGYDFYRAALKHMCKLGYLIRIPMPRLKGQFQKVNMELYGERQIDEQLKDEEVELLFGKEDLSLEEIQKIYPKRIFPHGSFDTANTPQQRIDNQRKENYYQPTKKPPNKKPLPEDESNAKATPSVVVNFLDDLDIRPSLKQKLINEHSQEKLEKIAERVKKWKGRKNDEAAIQTVIDRFDDWTDYVTKQELEKKGMDYCSSIMHYDGKKIGETAVVVGLSYVEFSAGSSMKRFEASDKDFVTEVESYLEKLQEADREQKNREKWNSQKNGIMKIYTQAEKALYFNYIGVTINFKDEKFGEKVREAIEKTKTKIDQEKIEVN